MTASGLVAVVPRTRAESLLRHLRSTKLLDRGRRICTLGDDVLMPILSSPPTDLGQFDARVEERQVEERTAQLPPFERVKVSPAIDPSLRRYLPSKWEKIGDVLILKVPRELEGRMQAVAGAYASVLGARSVLRDVEGIAGDWRIPQFERVWGGGTETVHVENGIRFKLDAAKVMFSSGNLPERARMARISNPAEVVVDMFAGIGYFAVPMAFHSRPRMVYACEVNPTAFHYLEENVRINRLRNLKPLMGDCRETAPEGVADRVVMGYLRAQEFLGKTFRVLKDQGVIHYHETCPNELASSRPWATVEKTAESIGRRVELLRFHRLKSYAPGVSHIVLDVKVGI